MKELTTNNLFKMKREKFIEVQMKKVLELFKTIDGKTFTVIEENLHTEEGMSTMVRTRNEMAKGLLYQTYFRSLCAHLTSFAPTHICSTVEEDEILERCELLINLYNGSEDFWATFWRGEQPINPEKVPFLVYKDDGSSEEILIDINEIKCITI